MKKLDVVLLLDDPHTCYAAWKALQSRAAWRDRVRVHPYTVTANPSGERKKWIEDDAADVRELFDSDVVLKKIAAQLAAVQIARTVSAVRPGLVVTAGKLSSQRVVSPHGGRRIRQMDGADLLRVIAAVMHLDHGAWPSTMLVVKQGGQLFRGKIAEELGTTITTSSEMVAELKALCEQLITAAEAS